MATEPAAGSGEVTRSLPAGALAILRDYLDQAPPELADWARSQRDLLPDSEKQASNAPGPDDREKESAAAEDEPEDFYNDMEGEDDILQRRRASRARRERGGTPLRTGPASKQSEAASVAGGAAADSAVRRRGGWAGLSSGRRMALVVLLMAGIIGGVRLAGQSAQPDPSPETMPSLTSTSQPVDSASRIAELTAAIEQDPDAIEERLELGVLQFNERQVKDAQRLWLEVTELAPDDVTAWYNLGFSYLSMEPAQPQEALKAWQRVVDLDPDSEMALTVSMHMKGLEMPVPEQDPTG